MWLLFSPPFPSLNQLCRHNHRIAFLGGEKKKDITPLGSSWDLAVSLPALSQSLTPDGFPAQSFKQACAGAVLPREPGPGMEGSVGEFNQTAIRCSPRLGPAPEF